MAATGPVPNIEYSEDGVGDLMGDGENPLTLKPEMEGPLYSLALYDKGEPILTITLEGKLWMKDDGSEAVKRLYELWESIRKNA